MSVINLTAPIQSDDLDISRLQNRYDPAINALITAPWGNGVLISGITLQLSAGNQKLVFRHNLGRKPTGAAIWNSTVQITGPWAVTMIDPNTCSMMVNVPTALTAPGSVDIWVG